MREEDIVTWMELVSELMKYDRKGVKLLMKGNECSPEEIATASVFREDVCYMRDYIQDERGRLREVRFDEVSEAPHKKRCTSDSYNYRTRTC